MNEKRKAGILFYLFMAFIMVAVMAMAIFIPKLLINANNPSLSTDDDLILVFDSIYGRVLDVYQNPVSKVELELFSENNDELYAVTDKDGSFYFYDVPVDVYEIKIITLPSDEYSKPTNTKKIDLYLEKENNCDVGTIYLLKNDNEGTWGPLE